MGFSCPHCSENIDNAMSKNSFNERLEAMGKEKSALESALKEASAKASGYDALVKERDGLASELGTIKQRGERTDSLREAGIADASMLEHFEVLYNAHAATNPDATWSEWMKGPAREHVLLAPHFPSGDDGGEAAPHAAPPADPGKPAPRKPPSLDNGAQKPPQPAGKMTPAQTAAHLKTIPLEKRQAEIDRLRAEGYGQPA